MIADWYVDPLGRFDGRFFDGVDWTDQVSDGGHLLLDPDWPPATPAVNTSIDRPVSVGPDPTPAIERRYGGDRRQMNAPSGPDRREIERRVPDIVIPRA